MHYVSEKFSPAPAILSTYLVQANYDDSKLSKLCKLNLKDQDDAKKTTFAWNYFSSNAKAADYKMDAPSKLKRTFTMALPGAILALARIVYDVFFCIYKLLSSSPSAFQNLKRLNFCLGRDVAQLASYIALPITDRALPSIAHHEVQRALLLEDTPKKIQQTLLFNIYLQNKDPALHAFESLYEGRQDDLVAFLCDAFKENHLNKIIKLNPSFLKNFDVEYWTSDDDKISKITTLIGKVKNHPFIFKILNKLIEKEKYKEFIDITEIFLNTQNENEELHKSLTLFFSKFKDKYNNDAQELAKALADFFNTKDTKKQIFFELLCSIIPETEISFLLPLLAEANKGFLFKFLSGKKENTDPLSEQQIKILETPVASKTDTEILSPELTAFTQIQTWIKDSQDREKVLFNLLYSYSLSGDVDKVLNIIEQDSSELLKIRAFIEFILELIEENVLSPETQQQLWKFLSTLLIKTKGEAQIDILNKLIFEKGLPVTEGFKSKELKQFYNFLKKAHLNPTFDSRAIPKALITRFSYHYLSAIGNEEKEYFEEEITTFIPCLIESLTTVKNDCSAFIKIEDYFRKDIEDKKLSTTLKNCLKTILEKRFPSLELLNVALEISNLLEDNEKSTYAKEIFEIWMKQPQLFKLPPILNLYLNKKLKICYKCLQRLESKSLDYEKIADWHLENNLHVYLHQHQRLDLTDSFRHVIGKLSNRTALEKLQGKIDTLDKENDLEQIQFLKNIIYDLSLIDL